MVQTPSGEEQKTMMYFIPVKVWDISSTMVIPGQEDKAKVFEPSDWKQDTNENREEITAMINALDAFAESKGIKIDYEELSAGHGGYSAGGRVVINSTYDGINKFSTYVHELTHEILHHTMDPEDRRRTGKAALEQDAESTAYIVLQYYGFESKDSARYLAIWKGDSKTIRERSKNIQKAAQEIIHGINKQMEKIQIQDSAMPNGNLFSEFLKRREL